VRGKSTSDREGRGPGVVKERGEEISTEATQQAEHKQTPPTYLSRPWKPS